MALNTQTLPIIFTKGLDQKIDSKVVGIPSLLELENAVFKKGGRLSKRFGYDVLGNQIEGSIATITKGEALGIFRDELNLYDGTKFYSYVDTTNRWRDKGNMVSVITQAQSLLRNPYQQSNINGAALGTLQVYAWEDSRGGVRYSVFDGSTNLVQDVLVAANAARPRVVVFGNNFLLFYSIGGTTSLHYRIIAQGTPTLLGAQVLFTSDMNVVPNYDVVTIDTQVFVVYYDDTNTITIQFLNTAYVISAKTFIAEDADNCVTVNTDDSQRLWISYSDNTNIRTTAYTFNLNLLLAPTTVEVLAGIVNATGTVVNNTLTLFYEVTAAATYNHFIKKNTVTVAGVVGTATVFKRSVGLASKAFLNNDVSYVNTVFDSTLQSTYFTISEDGSIVAKLNEDLGGVLINNTCLTNVDLIGTQYLFPNQIKDALFSENGTLYTLRGVNASYLDFSSENKFQNAELGELHIVGGLLQSYDGVSVVEHGFSIFPENVTFVANAGGGSMSDGTYQYQVTYEWTDNLGQIHRSAPSLPLTVILSGGGSSQSVDIIIPTLRLTAKTLVTCVVYRTESLGQIFYRTSSISSPVFNNTAVDTVTFVDTNADATILSNDPIYTTGGVLENIAPPSCSAIAVYKNRLFVLTEDNEIWYSKKRIEGQPVEFTDFFTITPNDFGGRVKALGVIDGNFILFKRPRIEYFSGEGPNDTGTNVDYGDPQLVTTDTGCDNINSIESTPNGLVFDSPKGKYLLDRSLQASYLGAPVEDFNGLDVTSSALLADNNEVRFLTNDNIALVYNYYFDQWSSFTNHGGEDSAIWNGTYVYLKANGQVWVQSSAYQDNNLPIVMKVTTSWISFAQLKGYQRVKQMMLFGEYISKHKLDVAIGYDFNPAFEQFETLLINDIYPITTYGEPPINTPYGNPEGIGYGGEFPLYQFGTVMTHQKCESVRFQFKDNQTSLVNFGEGFNFTAITLDIGVKKGLDKMQSKQSFGTS